MIEPCCYLDLDGVLADLVRASIAFHKIDIPINRVRWNFHEQFGFKDNPEAFWGPMDYEFTANIPWTPDGQELLTGLEDLFGRRNIAILTSPWRTKGCAEGKIEWIRRNLPQYSRQYFIGTAKHVAASPYHVLVDDHDDNVVNFRKRGRAVLVPRPWNERRAECLGDDSYYVPEIVAEVRRLRAEIETKL